MKVGEEPCAIALARVFAEQVKEQLFGVTARVIWMWTLSQQARRGVNERAARLGSMTHAAWPASPFSCSAW